LVLSSKTPLGEALFDSFIQRNNVSTGDLFSLFASCTPPLDALLGILPSLPPRYYSVSCSPREQGQETGPFVRFALAAVDYETPVLGRKFGLATRYLETVASPLLASGNAAVRALIPPVKVFPQMNHVGTEFHLPSNIKTPLILIGPGTGIAPFVGFVSHRKYQALERLEAQKRKSRSESFSVSEGTWRGSYEFEGGDIKDGVTKNTLAANDGTLDTTKEISADLGSIDIFFGCRCSSHDFIYSEELEVFQKEGIITNLHTAFSRESGKDKIYVQHRMKEESVAARVAHLILEEAASVYICGDGNAMAKDVQNALVEILSRHLNGEEIAKEYLDEMKSKHRLLLDIWM